MARRTASRLLVADAEAMAEVHALRPHAFADVGEQEPLAHRRREIVAVVAGDQRHHHVERRDAAGAGDAVAVEHEERRHDIDVGKASWKAAACSQWSVARQPSRRPALAST